MSSLRSSITQCSSTAAVISASCRPTGLRPRCHYNKEPVTTTCPHCPPHITQAVSYVNGLAPWLISGGLILIGCWLGCCLIPFCIDDLKDAEHRCPNCQQWLEGTG
uniref:LITAF domain-containing protein n=1 Tax=Macrostomum lignano TaxID=282301 RepID=A0A1I8JPF4_9PLAT